MSFGGSKCDRSFQFRVEKQGRCPTVELPLSRSDFHSTIHSTVTVTSNKVAGAYWWSGPRCPLYVRHKVLVVSDDLAADRLNSYRCYRKLKTGLSAERMHTRGVSVTGLQRGRTRRTSSAVKVLRGWLQGTGPFRFLVGYLNTR